MSAMDDPINESCTVTVSNKVFASDKAIIQELAHRMGWSEGEVIRRSIRTMKTLFECEPLKDLLYLVSRQDTFNLSRKQLNGKGNLVLPNAESVIPAAREQVK